MRSNLSDVIDLVYTDDGTVGLYNHEINDIYHSSYGALKEAKEKFIYPLNFSENFLNKKELKILDICYGIGYNTKAFLDYSNKLKYNNKISIDILEQDINLVLLSPFINDGIKNHYIHYQILKSLKYDYIKNNFSIIANKKFLNALYCDFNKKYCFQRYNNDPTARFNSFLHNIYYHYISRRNKKSLRSLKNSKFTLKAYFDDARKTVKGLSGYYDIVFLDAFTPAKLPTLWSLEFFQELYRITSNDSMIVTYSNSAAVRHAMIAAGFFAGKTFDKKNRPSGTVASKNEKFIKNKLTDYDIGLMNTNAGVYFCDKNLEMTFSEILQEHENRKKQLNLQSSSSYIKNYKKNCQEDKCTT